MRFGLVVVLLSLSCGGVEPYEGPWVFDCTVRWACPEYTAWTWAGETCNQTAEGAEDSFASVRLAYALSPPPAGCEAAVLVCEASPVECAAPPVYE